MLFYVYLDPEVVKDANSRGQYALKHFQEILKGFTVNCALISFPQQLEELKNHILEIPESFEIKEIKSLLVWLKKNNRFISSLIPDYLGVESDTKKLNEQYKNLEIDIIILALSNMENFIWEIECVNIDTYSQSNFERVRFEFTRNGKTFCDDEFDEEVFLNNYFKKLVLNANTLEICDYSFGKNYRTDYIYSWKVLIQWIADIRNHNDKLKIVIHSDKGDPNTAMHIITELKNYLPANKSDIEIILKYYIPVNTSLALPHERFLYTEQFAFNIGRGLDFFKSSTGKNRVTSLSYMNNKDIRKDVDACKHLLDSPSEIIIC